MRAWVLTQVVYLKFHRPDGKKADETSGVRRKIGSRWGLGINYWGAWFSVAFQKGKEARRHHFPGQFQTWDPEPEALFGAYSMGMRQMGRDDRFLADTYKLKPNAVASFLHLLKARLVVVPGHLICPEIWRYAYSKGLWRDRRRVGMGRTLPKILDWSSTRNRPTLYTYLHTQTFLRKCKHTYLSEYDAKHCPVTSSLSLEWVVEKGAFNAGVQQRLFIFILFLS